MSRTTCCSPLQLRGDEARHVQSESPEAIAALLTAPDGTQGVLYSALWDKAFSHTLFELMARRRRVRGEAGELIGAPLRPISDPGSSVLDKSGRTNNSFIFGDQFILKLFRHNESGIHPELEVGRFLTEETNFANCAPIAGRLEYVTSRGVSTLLGVLHDFVKHEADGWHFTMDSLSRFYDHAQVLIEVPRDRDSGYDLTGDYLERARLMGQRTGELHLALASGVENPEFAPEPFGDFYRQSLYHAILVMTTRVFQTLRASFHKLSPEEIDLAKQVLLLETEMRTKLRKFRDTKIGGMRIRTHGNYNLHEVLYTGKDFVIIDFEGNPSRHLTERRMKRSPLFDAASMLGSLHEAAHAARLRHAPAALVRTPEDAARAFEWSEWWYRWAAGAFLNGYLPLVNQAGLLPASEDDRKMLLDVLSLERLMIRIDCHLTQDCTMISVPLTGILRLLAV